MSDKNYKKPNQLSWKGRKTDPSKGIQYFYQAIELVDLEKDELTKKENSFAIVGYECEEGVRRNQGRIGAISGAEAIRKSMGSLAWHNDKKLVLDIGNVVCNDNNLEACQVAFSKTISKLLKNKITPIALGGGHDIAYGHFMGIRDALKDSNKNKIGIINFDAHFDLRPVIDLPNSGTPFNQISSVCKSDNQAFNYLAIGIQQQSNTKELFDIAERLGVQYIYNYECEDSNLNQVKEQIDIILEKNDHIYITVDMDGFSSAYAPGVSATSPFGFSPSFFLKVLSYILDSGKVISCDIAELNPIYDQDNATAKLAARIVEFMVRKIE